MLLVDTSVLIDVFEDDPHWAEWSVKTLRAQAQLHALAINPVIYSELSLAFARFEEIDVALSDLEISLLELSRPALFLAGRAFLQYKRSGGTKANVLPDFFIGAQAAVEKMPLLTRDATRYRTYFPGVQVIAPSE